MNQINEIKIQLTRRFIRDLADLQDIHYDALMQELGDLTEKGEEFLFDYVFNSDNTTFAAYLEGYSFDGPIYESQEGK